MDCFNTLCPFRVNGSSSAYICECIACPNRHTEQAIYTVTNNTIVRKESKNGQY